MPGSPLTTISDGRDLEPGRRVVDARGTETPAEHVVERLELVRPADEADDREHRPRRGQVRAVNGGLIVDTQVMRRSRRAARPAESGRRRGSLRR